MTPTIGLRIEGNQIQTKNTTLVELSLIADVGSNIPEITLALATGEARRNPADSPDEIIGTLLATTRALRNLSKETQKMANIRENENTHNDALKRKAKEAARQIQSDAIQIKEAAKVVKKVTKKAAKATKRGSRSVEAAKKAAAKRTAKV